MPTHHRGAHGGRRGRDQCLWRLEGIGFPLGGEGGFMEWEAHYLALKNMLDADRHTEGMDER